MTTLGEGETCDRPVRSTPFRHLVSRLRRCYLSLGISLPQNISVPEILHALQRFAEDLRCLNPGSRPRYADVRAPRAERLDFDDAGHNIVRQSARALCQGDGRLRESLP